MADSVAVSCPECGKKMNVRPDIIGKKIRCKGCDEVFLARNPGGKAAIKKSSKAPPKAKKPVGDDAIPFKDDEEEEVGSNPYGITDLEDYPRCPECANEMATRESIICLHCGYNTVTRLRAETKVVHDTTGSDWMIWLGPGILCVLAIIGLTTLNIIYLIFIDDWTEGSDWLWIFAHYMVKIWGSLINIFIMYHLARFAVKRLVLNPIPPEVLKRK
jgi:DNA-directed RNA polymerase subunit M/transcription elongation factor TFIIS